MRVSHIMISDIVTCGPDEHVGAALDRLYDRGVRMLPVVDGDNRVLGIVSASSLLTKVAPEYIASGDLEPVHFAPDLGLLQRRFHELLPVSVSEVMGGRPAMIKGDESLLAATAELIAENSYGYLLVVDDEKRLQGIVSCNDILRAMRRYEQGGSTDA